MGDVTYKISGTSAPFIAKIWNQACSSVSQYEHVEYSGTCVQFGNLVGSTCYNISTTDRIGNTVWTGFTTPTALVAPDLPEVVMTMGGLPESPQPWICFVSTGPLAKFTITPPLGCAESVCFDVDIITCNQAGASENTAAFWCDGIGFSCVCIPPSYCNDGCITRGFCLNYGDSIHYGLATVCNSSTCAVGYTCMCIRGITGTCVNASIGAADSLCTDVNFQQTTTTTTTTTTPVTVCIGDVNVTRVDLSTSLDMLVVGHIKLSRTLTSGESVRVNFVTNSCGTKFATRNIVHEICTIGLTDRLGVYECYAYTCVAFSPIDTGTNITDQSVGYMDVHCGNQGCTRFCVRVNSHPNDAEDYNAYMRTETRISSLSNVTGANFIPNTYYDRVGVVADYLWGSYYRGLCAICDSSGPTCVNGIPTGTGIIDPDVFPIRELPEEPEPIDDGGLPYFPEQP